MIKDAYISDDGVYRYNLVRDWADVDGTGMLFIMLNPSTADAVYDDATIRRCLSFAKREGCEYMEVVNLFAFRSKNPKDIKTADDPVGPENDMVIRQALQDVEIVVCAWGNHGSYMDRSKHVLDIVKKMGHKSMSLGLLNNTGEPKHPLYLKGDVPLMEIL